MPGKTNFIFIFSASQIPWKLLKTSDSHHRIENTFHMIPIPLINLKKHATEICLQRLLGAFISKVSKNLPFHFHVLIKSEHRQLTKINM